MDRDKNYNINSTRRRILQATTASASLASMNASSGILLAETEFGDRRQKVLEKKKVSLGFIPLTDCASLVIAQEKGFFEKFGLDVELKKQTSWSNIRDKVSINALDGAQMLATMPIATTLGIGTVKKPTLAALTMALNGNAITVSHELYTRMLELDPAAMQEQPVTARALKKVIEQDKQSGRPLMTFATVFPLSTHSYELRYWMAAAGIDPDRDVRLAVIPPAQMVNHLESRRIVGYCVGEPWNELAVSAGIGRTLITKYEIWNNSPEKVFAVNQEWAEQNPHTLKAIVKAMIEASQWIDFPENRVPTAEILSREEYVDAPIDVIKMSMTGTFQYARHLAPVAMPDFNVFHRYSANYPWLSHAQWYISQMYRWGHIDKPINILATAAQVYRPDIYTEAARELDLEIPAALVKTEGYNNTNWQLQDAGRSLTMGSDKFFDQVKFNPANLIDYIYDFPMKNTKLSKSELQEHNSIST
tara:strand:+ start:254 stop:1678 length:1425 start_codon:yes stop_codon:yes gene_type:complete